MHAAKFPVHHDLAGFVFEGSPVDRKLIHTLAELAFTEAAQNVVLVGGPGTGKTHLTTAIGVSGITRHGKRARFYSTVDLVNALEQEKTQGKAGRIALSLLRMDLVIMDELGYLPFSQADRATAYGLRVFPRANSAASRRRKTNHTRVGWMYSVSSLYDVATGVAPSDSIVNLRDHHRSHADIIEFSNRAFSEGRLRVATRYRQLKRPRDGDPGIFWQDVRGEVVRPASGGALNRQEAKAVFAALRDLLVTRGYEGTVGVVTPFRAQAQVLQELVAASHDLSPLRDKAELLVDTVHRFQGDERDVMFFSPVVSAGTPVGALGFLRSNGNLFNVAITRARGLLHVVGDRSAAAACGVDYLANFSAYVAGLDGVVARPTATRETIGPEFPSVSRPERVSDWERILYRALYAAGLRPIPQFSVEQNDLDFAIIVGERRLDIEVDGERYHRSWTGELCLRDQLRNRRLIELGWEVRRFWVYEVRDDLDACVTAVRRWAQAAEEAAA